MQFGSVEGRQGPGALGVALLAGLLAAPLLAAPAGASITGVCPDGSMFIVKQERDIPCDAAKQVDPSDMPPIRPQFLPRPYGWEKFHRENDPNNPYNLVTDVREQRPEGAPEAPSATRAAPPSVATTEPPPVSAPPPPQPRVALAPAPPRTPAARPSLSLSEDELHNLALIVEMSQQVAPAELRRRDDDLHLRFAHSPAFEAVLRDAWARRGRNLSEGPVLLFSARAARASEFWANLTFVQGHVAFHPGREDPTQLGVLKGSLGMLAEGEEVLGYAVLPPRIDLAVPVDIYWNDHQLTARLLR